MFATHPIHENHTNLWWWLVVIALAAAMTALMLATPLQGQQPVVGQPRPTAQQLWAALDAHRRHEPMLAVEIWRHLPRGEQGQVWRDVAYANACIEAGFWNEAQQTLERAYREDPTNAAVHFLLARWRMDRMVWREALPACTPLPPGHEWGDIDCGPNAVDMDRLVAIVELEQAVEYAPGLDTRQLLLPNDPEAPRVEDLLVALDIGPLATTAHQLVGGLLAEDGQWEEAEAHYDLARKAGGEVANDYVQLADRYAAAGRPLDATRNYAKALRAPGEHPRVARRLLENLGQAIAPKAR